MKKYFNDGNRALWKAAGYDCHEASVELRPPPPPDFTAAYRFLSWKYGRKSIDESRIKVTRFFEANDPFETRLLQDKKASLALGFARRMVDFKKKYGMLCFSEGWLSPAMWAHYAERHCGICLGFDLSSELKYRPINYESERYKDLTVAEIDGMLEDDFKDIVNTKYVGWKDEREIRVIVELGKMGHDGEHYYYRLDDKLVLREVVVGCRRELSDTKTIRALVDGIHSDVCTVRAAEMNKSFSIGPDKIGFQNGTA